MSTLPPPGVNKFPDDSLEKKVYNLVDEYKNYLPVENDRNRLGFSLYKYVTGQGDPPKVLIQSTKVKVEGIDPDELAAKLEVEINKIKASL